jgi:hypothetical protein
MMFHLPWPGAVLYLFGYFVVAGWFVSIPAIVILAFLGFSPSVSRIRRVAAFAVAAVLAWPFLVCGISREQAIGESARIAKLEAGGFPCAAEFHVEFDNGANPLTISSRWSLRWASTA